jgi:hypothetical protein
MQALAIAALVTSLVGLGADGVLFYRTRTPKVNVPSQTVKTDTGNVTPPSPVIPKIARTLCDFCKRVVWKFEKTLDGKVVCADCDRKQNG